MDNYFLSYPEKYQEYDPDNESYKAAKESAKEFIKKFPRIKVKSQKKGQISKQIVGLLFFDTLWINVFKIQAYFGKCATIDSFEIQL